MLKTLLLDITIDENDIGHAAETYFLINVNNGKTLGFTGQAGSNIQTLQAAGRHNNFFCLSRDKNARIEKPFMVFINKDRIYPICGVPDDVNVVAFRTRPKR